jgi:2-amino-4-hydroxy-6-hydroxymethyldihydropteridine diphosphokinase
MAGAEPYGRMTEGDPVSDPARVTSYIGLGANVGNARATLTAAVHGLAALPGAQLVGVSGLYRTRPVGVTDQPDFLNAAVALDVPARPDPETAALALLAALKQLEAALGRQTGQRWGPREIDLDLLIFGPYELDVGRADGRWLRVPHPEMARRLFVLAPLADLAPELQPPGWAETIEATRRRQEAVEGPEAVRRSDWTVTYSADRK